MTTVGTVSGDVGQHAAGEREQNDLGAVVSRRGLEILAGRLDRRCEHFQQGGIVERGRIAFDPHRAPGVGASAMILIGCGQRRLRRIDLAGSRFAASGNAKTSSSVYTRGIASGAVMMRPRATGSSTNKPCPAPAINDGPMWYRGRIIACDRRGRARV